MQICWEFWRIISIAFMNQNFEYYQRQVLAFQIILTVNYAQVILIWWKNEEPYILTKCFLNLNNSQRQILVFISFGCSVAITYSILLEIWRIISVAIMNQNMNYSQRQVLAIQMMLHVNFALIHSDMVKGWRVIFAAYMHLNNCFKCKVCTNKLNC